MTTDYKMLVEIPVKNVPANVSIQEAKVTAELWLKRVIEDAKMLLFAEVTPERQEENRLLNLEIRDGWLKGKTLYLGVHTSDGFSPIACANCKLPLQANLACNNIVGQLVHQQCRDRNIKEIENVKRMATR